jgi:threonine synthase
MGNIVGGYKSKRMGLPIHRLVAAVNRNNITDRVITTGKYYKSNVMHRTLSEAINIHVPYNFEPMLNYVRDEDPTYIRSAMMDVERTDRSDICTENLRKSFGSCTIFDDDKCSAIRTIRIWYNNYLCDPNTAVAFGAAMKLGYILDHRSTDTVTAAAETETGVATNPPENERGVNELVSLVSSPSSPATKTHFQTNATTHATTSKSPTVAGKVFMATPSPCNFQ